jgi:GT2 family glycosyltransferase
VPSLSVVIPARNEGRWIERAIRSVLEQDACGSLELLVVLGPSEDDTNAIVASLARRDARIRVLESPSGRTPAALNIGIRAARAPVIARVDAHGWLEPGYLSVALETLEETGAEAVGGVVRFVGTTKTGQAIALAEASPFGGGPAAFRSATQVVEADGLRWGVYRREVLERVGLFDEALLRNQDDELCHRIRQAGGRLIVTPRMRFAQVVRPSILELWHQYRQWGSFRVHTLLKHRRPATVRQLAAPALVALLMGAAVVEVGSRSRLRVGRGVAIAYSLGLCGAGVQIARERRGTVHPARISAAIATMHLAYGAGFWLEAFRALELDPWTRFASASRRSSSRAEHCSYESVQEPANVARAHSPELQ